MNESTVATAGVRIVLLGFMLDRLELISGLLLLVGELFFFFK